jgi:hypothetical protein
MPLTSALTLPLKDVQLKQLPVTRTMTTGTDKAFVLPRGAQILGFVLSGIQSDAGTTATLSIGTTSGTPTEYVNAVSVRTGGSGNGVNLLSGVAGAVGGKLTADTTVYVKYAETGGASTVGSWNLFVLYIVNSSKLAGVYQ